MELLQLQYFKTVAELEHLTKAAEVCSVSQPTLSASIQRLEMELGAKLFDRKGRGIELNACGRLFLSYVNIILDQIENAKNDVRDFARQQKNTIVADGTSIYMFSGLVERILEEYPGTVFSYLPRANTLQQSLEKLELDFCIASVRFSSPNLVSQRLTEEPLVIVASADSPLAGRKSVKLSELHDYYFATPRQDSFLWSHITEICRQQGFNPKIAYAGKTNQDVFAAVKSGSLIAISLKYYADILTDPDVIVLDIDYMPKQPVYISYARKQEENDFVMAVIGIIREYFAERDKA